MTSKTITLPHDKNSEMMVLGAMLNGINAISWSQENMVVNDFYFPEHQIIFKAIISMNENGHMVDVGTISTKIQKTSETSLLEVLIPLSHFGSGGVDYAYYGQILQNLGRLRQIIQASNDALNDSVVSDANADIVMDDLQKKLFIAQGIKHDDTKNPSQILSNFHDGKSFDDHCKWVHDQVSKGEAPYTGIASGYPILDRTFGFFRPACYYTIGARTGMGKTTFLLNMIKNMNFGSRKTKIGFFSLEMSSNVLIKKLLCLYSGVKFSDLEDGLCTPLQLQSISRYAQDLQKYDLFIQDQGGLRLSQLRARAKKMVQNNQIEILFIDYLTCIKSDASHSNNHLSVNEISKGLQSLAKELNIPIVALAQLNRNVTSRQDQRPTLSDFRESGSIEEDSDGCILLHRPEYYNPDSYKGVVEVIIAKNRLRGTLKRLQFKCEKGEVYQEVSELKETIVEPKQKVHNGYTPYQD